MLLPPDGITLPVLYRAMGHRADNVLLGIAGAVGLLGVDLADCQAPEAHTPDGAAAIAAAGQAMEAAQYLHLHLPLPLPPGLMRLVAGYPGPLVGHVYLGGDETLGQYLVRHGHATRAQR